MNTLKLQPVKFKFPFKMFTINIIIYIDLNKEVILNEGKCKEIK